MLQNSKHAEKEKRKFLFVFRRLSDIVVDPLMELKWKNRYVTSFFMHHEDYTLQILEWILVHGEVIIICDFITCHIYLVF